MDSWRYPGRGTRKCEVPRVEAATWLRVREKEDREVRGDSRRAGHSIGW